MRKKVLNLLPICLMIALLNFGCAQQSGDIQATTASAASKKQEAQVYKGKVVGKSKKAKTISIKVGKGDKAKTIMVKFDAKTKGIEHAAKGHAAIIAYEMRNGEPWATVVKPKLAQLPAGVTKIKTAELKALLQDNTAFVVIDARPAKRYAESHIAGAVNLPVPSYKEKAASILPQNKDQLLIVYCGGPT